MTRRNIGRALFELTLKIDSIPKLCMFGQVETIVPKLRNARSRECTAYKKQAAWETGGMPIRKWGG